MTDVTQEKMMPGSSKASASIDGSLWLAVVAIAGVALAIGTQHGNEKAIDLKLSQQDQRLAQQDQKIRDLETEVMLLRQDVSDLRIEAQSKLQPRVRPK
jgi:cell division protein FtsB